jgi:hypothetical protein
LAESWKKQAKGRGGKRPGAGRHALGKVKITMHVLPATRDSLGSKPGARVDELVKNETLNLKSKV